MHNLANAITFECMYSLCKIGQYDTEYFVSYEARKAWFLSIWARMDNYIADNNL